jgi:hypothetical protein
MASSASTSWDLQPSKIAESILAWLSQRMGMTMAGQILSTRENAFSNY